MVVVYVQPDLAAASPAATALVRGHLLVFTWPQAVRDVAAPQANLVPVSFPVSCSLFEYPAGICAVALFRVTPDLSLVSVVVSLIAGFPAFRGPVTESILAAGTTRFLTQPAEDSFNI